MIEARHGNNWLSELSLKHHMAIALACLALLEIIWFAGISKHVGFYLDDWTTLCTLKFGPQALPAMMAHYFFVDPKVIIRPVEVVQFACLFKLFGLKPFGYHVFNGVLEVLSAWLLYLCLVTYSKDRSLSFLAATLLLLLPLHDSTHYWVLASSVTLSLAFYLLSLYLTLIAKQRPVYFLLAAIAFTISIFSYESFLPLCAINCLCLLPKQISWQKIARYLPVPLSYVLSIALLLVYQRVLVPHLGPGWIHDAHFDIQHIFDTVCQGISILSPTNSLPAFSKLIGLRSIPISAGQTIWLALAGFLTSATCYLFSRDTDNTKTPYSNLILIGTAIVILSYTIFGLNAEYAPTLYSLVNRINTGAAIGVSIIIASMAGLLLRMISNTRVRTLSAVACTFILVIPLILANWSMSESWVVSWQTQQNIVQAIKNHKDKLKAADSILLADCPRYVDWAPVFDGVWDFQSMVRLVLNKEEAKGTVVSDRLQLFGDHLSDISLEYVCGVYPYQGMYCLFPASGSVIPVHLPEEFVAMIKKDGMTFDLSQQTIDKWNKEISLLRQNNVKEGQKIASPVAPAKAAI